MGKTVLMVVILGLIISAGCYQKDKKESEAIQPKVELTDTAKDLSEEKVEVQEAYHNKNKRYSFDIPPHWKGKYKIIEEKNWSRFVYIACPGLEEWIITIAVATEEEFSKFNLDPPGIPEDDVLARKNGFVYYYVTSIDVGFNIEQSEKYGEDFRNMYSSLGKIHRRFHLTD